MDEAVNVPEPRLAGELASLLDGSLNIEDFIAAIVHEAAQPLTAIQMLATALRESGESMDPIERDGLLADIEGQARFLHDMSDWMLQPFARELVVFDEMVEQAAKRCQVMASAHEIVSITDAAGLLVNCERVRVEASIRNLVCNAVRHSPNGSRITVGSSRCGENAVVSVSDEGEGIPAAEWDRIFDPYVRLSDGGDGVGLGLYIVRSCAQRHDGLARVGVSGPEGTTMEFAIRAEV